MQIGYKLSCYSRSPEEHLKNLQGFSSVGSAVSMDTIFRFSYTSFPRSRWKRQGCVSTFLSLSLTSPRSPRSEDWGMGQSRVVQWYTGVCLHSLNANLYSLFSDSYFVISCYQLIINHSGHAFTMDISKSGLYLQPPSFQIFANTSPDRIHCYCVRYSTIMLLGEDHQDLRDSWQTLRAFWKLKSFQVLGPGYLCSVPHLSNVCCGSPNNIFSRVLDYLASSHIKVLTSSKKNLTPKMLDTGIE